MAISKIKTLLALDAYAEYMMMPGWIFNQIYHPERPMPGVCNDLMYQSGYYGDPTHFIGRDDIARAIARAEERIARVLGFWPAPTWICNEEHLWQYPERGYVTYAPRFKTNWGEVLSPGTEAWTQLNTGLYGAGVPIQYTDEDGDGVLDTATVTFATTLTDPCEIEVIPLDRDPEAREWRIRPLDKSIDGGVFRAVGPRWLFLDPDNWITINEHQLDNAADFLEYVDIWRHYNDATSLHGRFFWEASDCTDPPCTETCQNGCMEVVRARNGRFELHPAAYSAGAWARSNWGVNRTPSGLRVWYYAGYRDSLCGGCRLMGSVEEAIIRLANVLLPASPCGCPPTRQRYEKDREILEVTTHTIAAAEHAFGTSARGAVYAHSVVKSMRPLGRGG
jgi:hypothetical protein